MKKVGHNNLNSITLKEFSKVEKYLTFLDTKMDIDNTKNYMFVLHYVFEGSLYDKIAYYSDVNYKEVYFFTPESFKLIGITHTLDETFMFLNKLLGGGYS